MLRSSASRKDSIEWDGRFYMNVTWFNLPECTKIVLLSCILNMLPPSIGHKRAYALLQMNEDEIADVSRINKANGVYSIKEDEEEARREETEAIEKLNAAGLEYVEAEGDNSTWAANFLEPYGVVPEPDYKYTVTQDDIDAGKRFVLCRYPDSKRFNPHLLTFLDHYVGQRFDQDPDLPHALKEILPKIQQKLPQKTPRRILQLQKAPDVLNNKRPHSSIS